MVGIKNSVSYYYDIKSYNQLLTIICQLELIGVDTYIIDLRDFKDCTVCLTIKYKHISQRGSIDSISVGTVFRKESSWRSTSDNSEECESFTRLLDVINTAGRRSNNGR